MTGSFRLHSVGGVECTPEFREAWKQVGSLPAAAISSLWELLHLAIAEDAAEEFGERARAYCKLYDVPHEQVEVACQAVAFLLNSAAAQNLDAEAFAADLENLGPAGGQLGEVLMSGYTGAIQTIREGLLRSTVLDHGKLLTGLDWRLDAIHASQRGMHFNMPMILFTLRYQDNPGGKGEEERLTLYLTPQVLSELKTNCEYLEKLLQGGQDTSPAQA